MDPDSRTRAAIEEHWRASERGETKAEHAIYAEDAILDYPQSGERFRSRATIAAQRGGHPASRHFTVIRIAGSGNLWVSECIITYDGAPTYSVSIMEFDHEHVVHETQYFADPFRAARRARRRPGGLVAPDERRPHRPAAAGGRAAQMAMVERAIAEGLAERLGTDPERDPYPSLLAAAAAGVFRASISFWAGSGGTVPLEHLIDQAFRALADGLPERRELRNITGKDNT